MKKPLKKNLNQEILTHRKDFSLLFFTSAIFSMLSHITSAWIAGIGEKQKML
jgi:hypothetical protein